MCNVGYKCTYSMLLQGGLNEAMSVIRHLKVPLLIPTPGSPLSHSLVISPVQVQQLEGNQPHIGTPWQHLTLWLPQVLSRSALGLSSWCWRGGCSAGPCSRPTHALPNAEEMISVAIFDNWKMGSRIKSFSFLLLERLPEVQLQSLWEDDTVKLSIQVHSEVASLVKHCTP